MSVMMVVRMDITDPAWMTPYFEAVPAILAEYGARSVAGGRDISLIEGRNDVPQRVAILEFPTIESVEGFMEDPRYRPFRDARRAGSQAEIWVFENDVKRGELC